MFQPYQSKRAFEDVADQIRKAILDKKLKKGDRLPSERDLANKFQAGRMTIREALRRVEISGFITIKKGGKGGAFVGAPESEALPSMIMDNFELQGITEDEISQARMTIEPAIVKTAIEVATEDDLARIERNLHESSTLQYPADLEQLVNLSISFHILIAESSHNLPFVFFVSALAQWSRRRSIKWHPSHKEVSWMRRSHDKIFRSIRNRDVDLAQRLLLDDIIRMKTLRAKGNQF